MVFHTEKLYGFIVITKSRKHRCWKEPQDHLAQPKAGSLEEISQESVILNISVQQFTSGVCEFVHNCRSTLLMDNRGNWKDAF